MSKLVRWIDETFYPEFGDNWDDELFRRRILNRVESDWDVLDLGAGAGFVRQMNFRDLVGCVSGVDPDPRVLQNPALDTAKVGVAENLPFNDASFDLIFCDNVFEHLSDPGAVFREVWRTLRPGGLFLFKTPNRRHYVPQLARLTPHSFHQFVNFLRGRPTADTFPTHYRANTPAAIRNLAQRNGFVVSEIELVEGRPEYLRWAAPSYLAGLTYERVVNSVKFLQMFRVVLIGSLSKPEEPQTSPTERPAIDQIPVRTGRHSSAAQAQNCPV